MLCSLQILVVNGEASIIWLAIISHTLGNCHVLHLISNSPLVLHLSDLQLLFFNILFPLLLIDLLLQCLLHSHLLSFPLVLNNMFFISAL
jgi:hypothetical protein